MRSITPLWMKITEIKFTSLPILIFFQTFVVLKVYSYVFYLKHRLVKFYSYSLKI